MKLTDFVPVPLPAGHPLPEEVRVGPGRRAELADVAARHLAGTWLRVGDPDTLAAAGDPLPDLEMFRLERHPHADDETVARAVAAARGAGGLVAIGSGTVNDVAKRAAHELGIPYVVLGTAASMNGYASGIAALLSRGLKITAPARPPRAILLDTDILAAAPLALTRAGLGDLLSKPVSDSDWWLADRIEGTGYSTLPSLVTDAAVADATAHAAGLATGDRDAHAALGRALVLSGVAMVVAGSSAPASGGEHLLSHLWDMEALAAGRETRLHGAQVGVATCISAALYQRLLRATPVFTEPPPWEDEAARLHAEHGALADSVLGPAKRKHDRAAARVALLRDRWPEIRDGLAARKLPTPAEVRAPLAACGAPNTLEHLGISRADAARVLRIARDIRDRVTVLDVAFEIGVLPRAIGDVLDDAGV